MWRMFKNISTKKLKMLILYISFTERQHWNGEKYVNVGYISGSLEHNEEVMKVYKRRETIMCISAIK